MDLLLLMRFRVVLLFLMFCWVSFVNLLFKSFGLVFWGVCF